MIISLTKAEVESLPEDKSGYQVAKALMLKMRETRERKDYLVFTKYWINQYGAYGIFYQKGKER